MSDEREVMALKIALLVITAVLAGGGSLAKKTGGPPANYPVQIQESSIDDVPKYGTVIQFNIDIVNTRGTPYEVTVTPLECCLEISANDTDCESMQLRPPRTLRLGLEDSYDNKTGTVSFLFRNLYCRFRKGNCTFLISTKGKLPSKWKHTILFDTHPDDDEEYDRCAGLDQDPDRSCSPVDCAIKYKGKRNFYRNTTGRCEPVVECHTRGSDGVTITAYYDTEMNQCHSLDLNSSENAIYHTESAPDNPADHLIMPSLLSDFGDVEINMDDLSMDATMGFAPLDCNHGVQQGDFCVCDEGWASSGIDSKDQEHWCDVRDSSRLPVNTGPKRLTYIQELTAIISLSVLNLLLLVGWSLLVCCLCCRGKCASPCKRSS